MTTTHQASEGEDQIRPIQFLARGSHLQLPAPLIRVTTCGLLTIEIVTETVSTDPPLARYASLTPEQLRGRGTAPALTLLKLLLSRPERFALRDWLIEQFCRDREVFSSVRLDNIVSQLRSLLCLPAYEDLRTHLVAHMRGSSSSGDGYQLVPYPLIWTDIDALAWQVEQAARMERFGDDPLPYWEQAYALAKQGIYLPDELYSDWTAARRGEVAGMLRQSVQALARLYLSRYGEAGEEEALLLLRSYWQEYPQEEDVLRPLMELLGQRECYQEALDYYARLETVLSEVGGKPDTRTRDLAEYVRTKQIQPRSITPPLQKQGQDQKYLPFRASTTGAIIDAGQNWPGKYSFSRPLEDTISLDTSILWGLKVVQLVGVANLRGERSLLCRDIQALVDRELKMLEESIPPGTQEEHRISRRQALITIAALPTTMLLWKSENVAAGPDPAEFLPQCAASVTACWHMLKGDGLVAVEHMLPKFVPTLTDLALHPSVYQQEAGYLGAQANILQAILAMHQLNVMGRERYCRAAIKCGRASGDNRLTATALMYLGYTYSFCYRPKKPELAIQAFLDGLKVLGSEESLIRSDIAMGLAEAYAQCRNEHEALRYMTIAQDAFPIYPESDQSYVYAECGLNTLYQWEGKMYLELAGVYDGRGYQQNAWDAIARSAGTMSVSERSTNETIIYQADAAQLLGDLRAYTGFLHDGAQMALMLGSQKRYAEAYEAHQRMPEKWRAEPQIKLLEKEVFRQVPV